MPTDEKGKFYIENDHRANIPRSEWYIESTDEMLDKKEKAELRRELSSIKLEPKSQIASDKHAKAGQSGLDFEKENDPSKSESKPDLDKILREGMAAEELLTFANLDGKISKRELDNIALDACDEGKAFSYSKVGAPYVVNGEIKYQQVAGEVSVNAVDGKPLAKSEAQFDSNVPMTELLPLDPTKLPPVEGAGRGYSPQ